MLVWLTRLMDCWLNATDNQGRANVTPLGGDDWSYSLSPQHRAVSSARNALILVRRFVRADYLSSHTLWSMGNRQSMQKFLTSDRIARGGENMKCQTRAGLS